MSYGVSRSQLHIHIAVINAPNVRITADTVAVDMVLPLLEEDMAHLPVEDLDMEDLLYVAYLHLTAHGNMILTFFGRGTEEVLPPLANLVHLHQVPTLSKSFDPPEYSNG